MENKFIKLICIKTQHIEDENLCDFREGNEYEGEITSDNQIIVAGNHGDIYTFDDLGKDFFQIV